MGVAVMMSDASTRVRPGAGATSAAAALSLLDETEVELQLHAIRSLDALADAFWPEISHAVVKIQALSEEPSFPDTKLASIVAAKVLFHLGELDEALEYALAAGTVFQVTAPGEFASTLRARCIDEYIAIRAGGGNVALEAANLEPVVEKILDDCVARGEVKEALGIALEAHRPDRIESAVINGCKSPQERHMALSYCLECAQNLVTQRYYRHMVLQLVAGLLQREEQPDYVTIAHCMAIAQNALGVASTFSALLKSGTEDDELLALQIAFDLFDNDTPAFAAKVSQLIGTPAAGQLAPPSQSLQAAIAKVRSILSGPKPSQLVLDFLSSQSRTDAFTLQKVKLSLDARSSVGHTGLIFTNAIMYGGTAIDSFLRENLDWLQRATCWAKFSATACLGLIHARHSTAALNLLSPYLSSPTAGTSAYSEGGALYALGLITASGGCATEKLTQVDPNVRPVSAAKYLTEALLHASGSQTVQHGACLGLGLASMASWDGVGEEPEVYEELKSVLFSESAVAGEAAGLAMGLVCLGSGSDKVLEEMLAYARETQHEKIIRGLAMGMAMTLYAREEEAEGWIRRLISEKDPILRYGGMYAIALAYAGTSKNSAVKKLLHSAVSDVADDVRRAAVTAIGFVMFRHPNQVPKVIDLLSESCHANVRYGAAMAVGIACAGTGLPAAADILERLTVDPSDFVRQGALISLAMVFSQHTDARSPRSGETRKLFEKTIADKHEEVLTKFGAVIATGIMDCGGRNAVISLSSSTGHRRMSAIIGLAMFTQFWYWFPLVHFLGLSLRPAAFIGLTKDLKMPVMEIRCDTKPAVFGYPPNGPPQKAKEQAKVPTAILSVTVKHKARAKKKADKEGAEKKGDSAAETTTPMEIEEKGDEKQDVTPTTLREGQSHLLKNPCRVLPGQEKFMSIPKGRYVAVKNGAMAGFVMLKDTMPELTEEFVSIRSLSTPAAPAAAAAAAPAAVAETSGTAGPSWAAGGESGDGGDGTEPAPPQPFEYQG